MKNKISKNKTTNTYNNTNSNPSYTTINRHKKIVILKTRDKHKELFNEHYFDTSKERKNVFNNLIDRFGEYKNISKESIFTRALSENELRHSQVLLEFNLLKPIIYLDKITCQVDFSEGDIKKLKDNLKLLKKYTNTSVKIVPVGSHNNMYKSCINFTWQKGSMKFTSKLFLEPTENQKCKSGKFDIKVGEVGLENTRLMFNAIRKVLSSQRYYGLVKDAHFTRVEVSLLFRDVPFIHLFAYDSAHSKGHAFIPQGKKIGSSEYNGNMDRSHTISYDPIARISSNMYINKSILGSLAPCSKIERVEKFESSKVTCDELASIKCNLSRVKTLKPTAILKLPKNIQLMVFKNKIRGALKEFAEQDKATLENFMVDKDKAILESFMADKSNWITIDKNKIAPLQEKLLTNLASIIQKPYQPL